MSQTNKVFWWLIVLSVLTTVLGGVVLYDVVTTVNQDYLIRKSVLVMILIVSIILFLFSNMCFFLIYSHLRQQHRELDTQIACVVQRILDIQREKTAEASINDAQEKIDLIITELQGYVTKKVG